MQGFISAVLSEKKKEGKFYIRRSGPVLVEPVEEEELTGNVDVLHDVKNIVLVNLPLLLSIQYMIYRTVQAYIVHVLSARQFPVSPTLFQSYPEFN